MECVSTDGIQTLASSSQVMLDDSVPWINLGRPNKRIAHYCVNDMVLGQVRDDFHVAGCTKWVARPLVRPPTGR